MAQLLLQLSQIRQHTDIICMTNHLDIFFCIIFYKMSLKSMMAQYSPNPGLQGHHHGRWLVEVLGLLHPVERLTGAGW